MSRAKVNRPFYKKIAENVKKELKARQISVQEVAEMLGVTPSVIYSRNEGRTEYTVEDLYRIADECLIPVQDLFQGVEDTI